MERNREFIMVTIGSVIGAIFTIWAISGCVEQHAHVKAPSNARVQGNINTAQTANTEAQQHNASARTKAKRIEDKTVIIQKYWVQ